MTLPHRRLAALLFAALVLVSATAAPAAAASIDDLVDEDVSIVERVDATLAGIGGWIERVTGTAFAEEDDGSASEDAEDFKEVFNAHNGSIQTWVNNRTDADNDLDVIELEFSDEDGETATVYLVATVNNSSYEAMRIVDSTNRTVDETVEADPYLSRNAEDELDSFIDQFVDEDRDLTAEYKAHMIGKYGASVDGTLVDGGES